MTGSLIPLTAAQLAQWFAQRLDPMNPMYQLAACTEIRGSVDVDLLRRATDTFLMEAEPLRVRFVDTDDGPMQEICPEPRWSLSSVDLSAEPDPDAAVQAWLDEDLARPADLDGPPLGDTRLFRLGPHRYLWYRRAHHLITDGYAALVGGRRAGAIYTAMARGESSPSRFGSLRSIVDDDLAYQNSDRQKADQEFWLSYLAGRAEPVTLAGDRRELAEPSGRSVTDPPHRARQASADLVGPLVADLDRAAEAAGVSWPHLVIGVTAAYLHRMTGAPEVTLGLPVTARMSPLARSVPATVSNVVPLRCAVTPDLSLRDCAVAAGLSMRAVRPHQRFRVEQLRRLLGLRPGQWLYGPQINILPNYSDVDVDGQPTSSWGAARGPFDDMAVYIYRDREPPRLQVHIDADPARYTAEALTAHLGGFMALLEQATRGLDTPIGRLDPTRPTGTPR